MVTFTGSTRRAGRSPAPRAAPSSGCFLELGGKSAAIVRRRGLQHGGAVRGVLDGHPRRPGLRAHVATSGAAQTQRRSSRLIQTNFGHVRYGEQNGPGTYMGPLINAKQRDKVDGMVKRAVARSVPWSRRRKKDPASSTPRPCWPTSTRTADRPGRGVRPVLAVIAYEDDDDCRAHRQQFHLLGCRRHLRRPGNAALAMARRIRTGTFSINGGGFTSQPGRAVRRVQAVGHRPRDGRGPASTVLGARRSRDGARPSLHVEAEADKSWSSTRRDPRPPGRHVRLRSVRRAGCARRKWGADVIRSSTPSPAIRSAGCARPVRYGSGDPSPNIEHANRGKRSRLGLDMSVPEGREVLLELARRSGRFLTSFLPGHRQKFGIDVDDIRAVNRRSSTRAVACWTRGQEANKGRLYDMTGVLVPGPAPPPPSPMGRRHGGAAEPAYGDTISGTNLAGGIAAALVNAERTRRAVGGRRVAAGTAATWALGHTVALTNHLQQRLVAQPPRCRFRSTRSSASTGPKGRPVHRSLMMQPTSSGPTCAAIDRADLIDDPRFATASPSPSTPPTRWRSWANHRDPPCRVERAVRHPAGPWAPVRTPPGGRRRSDPRQRGTSCARASWSSSPIPSVRRRAPHQRGPRLRGADRRRAARARVGLGSHHRAQDRQSGDVGLRHVMDTVRFTECSTATIGTSYPTGAVTRIASPAHGRTASRRRRHRAPATSGPYSVARMWRMLLKFTISSPGSAASAMKIRTLAPARRLLRSQPRQPGGPD